MEEASGAEEGLQPGLLDKRGMRRGHVRPPVLRQKGQRVEGR